MNHKEYVEQSERTEKKFENGMVIPEDFGTIVVTLLRGFGLTAEALDITKKHLIYGKGNTLEASTALLGCLNENGEELNRHITYPELELNQDQAEILHAVLGIVTEVGELIDATLDYIVAGKELDKANIGEEIGDLRWYEAILIRKLGLDTESINKVNIDKLKARYPERFDSEKALNRDLKAEREILEDGC